MSGVATAAAWLLAAVFAWAAGAKLAAAGRTAGAMRELRLPAPTQLAVAVPVAEAALAVALLARPRAGGIAALVLLAAFSVVLGAALRRPEPVSCGCFGSGSAQPVSPATLLRNGLLAVLAAATLPATVPTLPALPDLVAASVAALVGLVVLALAEVRHATGRLLDVTVSRGPWDDDAEAEAPARRATAGSDGPWEDDDAEAEAPVRRATAGSDGPWEDDTEAEVPVRRATAGSGAS